LERALNKMAEKEAPKMNLPYDWNKLELAQAAASYLNEGEKGLPHVQKSLELMLQDIGFADPIAAKTLSTPSIAGEAIRNYLTEYSKHKNDQTIEEFINYHGKTIEDYLGPDSSNVEKELAPFMSKTNKDIEKEYGKAVHILEGEESEYGLYSAEDVENAKKTVEKYGKLLKTINKLEERKISAMRNRVEDAMAKDFFIKNYAKKEGG